LIVFGALVIYSCSKDDGPGNQAPEQTSLLNPSNQSKDLDVSNIELRWQAAIDPNKDAVTYDVYLDTILPPETKIRGDINGTSLKLPSDLEYDKTYFWSVTAKDNSGAESISNTGTFSTRKRTTEELIIGKWIFTHIEEGGVTVAAPCQDMSYFEFDDRGNFFIMVYAGDPCEISTNQVHAYTIPNDNTVDAYNGAEHFLL